MRVRVRMTVEHVISPGAARARQGAGALALTLSPTLSPTRARTPTPCPTPNQVLYARAKGLEPFVYVGEQSTCVRVGVWGWGWG